MSDTAPAAVDPLFLLPVRYEDRTRITPLGALLPGTRAVVEGEVQLADIVFRRRRTLLVRISDGSGFLNLRFFYFSRAQMDNLARGTRLRCAGEVRRGPQGLEMVHPGIPAHRQRSRAAGRSPHAHLSADRRRHAGSGARQRQSRAGKAGRKSRRGPVAGQRGGATAPAAAARGTGVHASPAGGHVAGRAGRRPQSGAAPPVIRGTAGAPAFDAATQAAHPERAGARIARSGQTSAIASSPACPSRSPARSSVCWAKWPATCSATCR